MTSKRENGKQRKKFAQAINYLKVPTFQPQLASLVSFSSGSKFLFHFNPYHLLISVLILHTDPYIFPMVLTTGICLTLTSICSL